MQGISLNMCPSLGGLVGTSLSRDHLQQLNSELGNSNYFGSINDILKDSRDIFVKNIIAPIRNLGNTIKNAINGVISTNSYIPITSEDQLSDIPSCMHMPILQYAPIRKLFDQGRIFGFGYEFIPTHDTYGRLINNGRVEDVASAMDKDGAVEFSWEWRSDDPDLTFEDMDSIEETRDYIDHILDNTNIDPTDYLGEPRG